MIAPTVVTLQFGAMCDPLKDQLSKCGVQLNGDHMAQLEHLQRDLDAVIRLAVRGLMPAAMKTKLYKRIGNQVTRIAERAMKQ